MDIVRFIACLFIVSTCYSQDVDSSYVESFREYKGKLSVQVFTLNTSNSFTLDYAADDMMVELEPNSKTTLGVSVQYDIVSVSLGFAPSFFANNADNGDSRMTSFGLDLFPGRFVQRLDYYYQRGITLEAEGGSIYLRNLRSMKAGGSTAFIFNRKFSYRSIGLQNAKQVKSAGTFAPTLSYYYTELDSKKQEGFGEKDYFVNIALTPTYYYNWVIAKNFMISAGLGLGGGVALSDENGPEVLVQASILLGIGYNSERFFAGINSRGFASNHKAAADVVMDDIVNYGTLFIGYRFDAPSFLVKGKEKIIQKLKE